MLYSCGVAVVHVFVAIRAEFEGLEITVCVNDE